MKDKAILGLKGREATAAELGVTSGTMTRAVNAGLARIAGNRKASHGRPARLFKLTREGAMLARKLERQAVKA